MAPEIEQKIALFAASNLRYDKNSKGVIYHDLMNRWMNLVIAGMKEVINSPEVYLTGYVNTKKEYILCAATWYKELKLIDESGLRNRGNSPYNVDKGIVLCGWRHTHPLYQKVALTGLADSESGEYVQGFLTSKNRFVDRKEALKIATAQNQITHHIPLDSGVGLTSEDIY
jgi:hypothetical protein